MYTVVLMYTIIVLLLCVERNMYTHIIILNCVVNVTKKRKKRVDKTYFWFLTPRTMAGSEVREGDKTMVISSVVSHNFPS